MICGKLAPNDPLVNIQKAWNLTIAYSFIRGTGKNLANKNKQRTPTPNMKCHRTEQSMKDALWAGYTYPKGRLLPSCFGLAKISGFLITKTSANKRFLLCLFPSAYDAQTSLGAGLRCKCTTIFRSGQRSMNIFAKYVLFSELNISVQSLNIFKICDSQRFASCVVMHIKNRVGIRAL